MRSRSRIPDELRRWLVVGGAVVLFVLVGIAAVLMTAQARGAAIPGSTAVAFAGRASSTGQAPGTVPALPESASATAVANSAAGLDAEAKAARKAARKADEPAPDPDSETDPVITGSVPAAPGIPAGVSAVAGNGVDVVSWTPSLAPGLTYVITQTASADGQAIEVARVDAMVASATISVGEQGIRYYYVRAVDDIGQVSDLAGPVSTEQVAMSGEVTPSGATLSSSNGDVILELPAGAYEATTTVTVTERTDVDGPGGGILSLAGIYDIQPSGSLGVPATLRIRYQLSIQYFSIAQRLLEATELLTREGSGAWVPAATDVHVDGGYVVGGLTHFSEWTPGTIQPHGTSPATTNYCDGVCHTGSAMPGSLIGYPIRDKSVCYLCHGSDAPGQPAREPSRANIQAELKDFVGQTFDPATESRHPIGEGDLQCTTCHDPHANPTLGYAGILRVKDPFGRIVRSTATTPAGEAFCWACHGVRENRAISVLVPGYYLRTGGNKQTGYTGSAHVGNSTASGAGSCTGCHAGHGSPGPSLLMGSEEHACLGCHTANPAVATDPAPDVASPNKRDESLFGGETIMSIGAGNRIGELDAVALGDIDNDGDVDVVTEYMSNTTSVSGLWVGLNRGETQPSYGSMWITSLETNRQWLDVALGDVDGDGDLDVAATTPNPSGSSTYVYLFTNPGGTGYWPRTEISNQGLGGHRYVEMADLSGDGVVDIVYTINGSKVEFAQNNGNGTSWTKIQVAAGNANMKYHGLTTGDVNNDGRTDVLFSTQMGTNPNDPRLVVRRSVGASPWFADYGSVPFPSLAYYEGDFGRALDCGDIDGDGYADVAWGTKPMSPGQPISGGVFMNNRGLASTWQPTELERDANVTAVHIPGASMPNTVMVRSEDHRLTQHYRTGSGWDAVTVSNAGYDRQWVLETGDMDDDGDQDILLAGNARSAPWELWYIKSESAGHPIGDPLRAGRHRTDETPADLGGANRHVECADCHDSHAASKGAHAMGTNLAAPALDGVWGVKVTNSIRGTTPQYVRTEDVTYEYEVCLKCHSAYVPGYTGLDMSVLFNPANMGTHPIEGPGANIGIRDDHFTLGTPWNPTEGDDEDYGEGASASPLMTCSDCHTSDRPSEARGPHGSTFPNLLRARVADDGAFYQGQNDLCYVCHDYAKYHTGNTRFNHGHVTQSGVYCLDCHDPHGSANKPHLLKIPYIHATQGGTVQNLAALGSSCGTTASLCHSGLGYAQYTYGLWE